MKISSLVPTIAVHALLLTQTLLAQDTKQPEPAPTAATNPTDSNLPTVKDILHKSEMASGGRDIWKTFHSRSMKGVYQTEDTSTFFGIEILSKEPDKRLSKITLPGDVVIREVCNGQSAWIEDARGGTHEFTGATQKARIHRCQFADQAATFLLAVTGHLVGTEKVGAHNTYVIEFSPEKNTISKLYFDTDSGFVVRVDDSIHADAGDYQVATYLDDYRPVDGAFFPFRMRHVEKGAIYTVRITQIKNNVPLEDSVFQKPVTISK